MIIVPALLEATTTDLINQISRITKQLPDVLHLHIDIMDGHFVVNRNDIDPQAIIQSKIKTSLELHLMVKDPIAYMRAWRPVDNVFRVLFHHETPGDPLHLVNFARKEGWDVGVVLNPETPLSETEPYISKIDVLQCMSVHPGQQGAPFVPEVLEKIKTFTTSKHICEYSKQPVMSAADGAVNSETIVSLKKAGVEIFNVGSALTRAENIQEAYETLHKLITE